MTIEVRQLLIRAQVGQRPAPSVPAEGLSPQALERLRAEILQACRALLREQQAAARER